MQEVIEALKMNMSKKLDNQYSCMPAIVVGVQNLAEGCIDVQPIIGKVYDDNTVNIPPAILSVPIVTPQTRNSALLLPVNQGDSVLLVFSQRDISTFKGGSREPYEPETSRTGDINDAFAILGINPLVDSVYDPSQHTLPHSLDDVVVVHNIGTANENEVRLKRSGDMEFRAKNFNFIGTSVNFQVDKVTNMGDNIVEGFSTLNGGGETQGISHTEHKHAYTDDGNPMITDVPQ
jgi:hypothetical protein